VAENKKTNSDVTREVKITVDNENEKSIYGLNTVRLITLSRCGEPGWNVEKNKTGIPVY